MNVQSQFFGKVAVLMGGWSAEREISLLSGEAVYQALISQNVDAHRVDVTRQIIQHLVSHQYDCAFNILHGSGGEDGVMQGVLDTLQIPYTGSGVTASALAMDKVLSKRVFVSAGLPTPAFKVLEQESDWQAVVGFLGLPLIVKPAEEGSSIGMSLVHKVEDLPSAWALAGGERNTVFAEQWIDGEEYTVGILQEEALPSIQLKVSNDFYDYEAKYESNETVYLCPSNLSKNEEAEIQRLALAAFKAVGAKGWGRVDFMRDQDGKFWILEINTQPGMTSHSLVPKAAVAAGINFEALVMRILMTSLSGQEVGDG